MSVDVCVWIVSGHREKSFCANTPFALPLHGTGRNAIKMAACYALRRTWGVIVEPLGQRVAVRFFLN